MDLLNKLKITVDQFKDSDTHNIDQLIDKVRSITSAIETEYISHLLNPIIKSMPELAKKLGKMSPNIIIKDHNIRLNSDIVPVIKNVFNHEFRNSMDHGLESADECKANAKHEKGTITLDVNQQDSKLILSLSDDERGLAIEKIKQKAVNSG